MKRFLKLIISTLKMTVRNWHGLFLMLMIPIIIMTLLGWMLGGEGGSIKLAITDQDKTPLSKSIVKAFDKVDGMEVEKGEAGKKLELLKDSKLDVVLVIKKGFAKDFPNKPSRLNLYYDPSDTVKSQVARSSVQGIVAAIEKRAAKTPTIFAVKEQKVVASNLKFIDFLLPGIIGMSIMMTAIFGLSASIVGYREQGILRRIKITPLPLSHFLASQVLVHLFMSFIQTVFLIIFAKYVFGVHIVGSLLFLSVVVIVGSLCFITMGFFVAAVSNSKESADALGNILTMPMMFLSGIFFPIDLAPKWLQPVIQAMPLKFFADALRDITVKDKSLAYVQDNLFILLAITAVIFIALVKLFRWEVKPS